MFLEDVDFYFDLHNCCPQIMITDQLSQRY
jgi:hypothetical protein